MTAPTLTDLPDPNTLQFSAWASIAAEQLAEYGVPTPPVDEATWTEWAAAVCGSIVEGAPLPEPHGFITWRDWAAAVLAS